MSINLKSITIGNPKEVRISFFLHIKNQDKGEIEKKQTLSKRGQVLYTNLFVIHMSTRVIIATSFGMDKNIPNKPSITQKHFLIIRKK